MSKMLRPPTLLRPLAFPGRLHPRTFSTSLPSLSALFNLNGLAHSRESQYLSKERGLPRTEYSSNIHLIRSSEVDPFPNAPGASKHAIPEGRRSPQRLGGRQAPIAAVAVGGNDTHAQHVDAISFTAQKTIDELKMRLREVSEENARLSVAALQRQNRGPVSNISRDILRVFVFLLGSYGLIAFFGPAALQKFMQKEPDETKAAESRADASVMQIEESNEGHIKIPNYSGPGLISQKELQDAPRIQKNQNPLRFLWA